MENDGVLRLICGLVFGLITIICILMLGGRL